MQCRGPCMREKHVKHLQSCTLRRRADATHKAHLFQDINRRCRRWQHLYLTALEWYERTQHHRRMLCRKHRLTFHRHIVSLYVDRSNTGFLTVESLGSEGSVVVSQQNINHTFKPRANTPACQGGSSMRGTFHTCFETARRAEFWHRSSSQLSRDLLCSISFSWQQQQQQQPYQRCKRNSPGQTLSCVIINAQWYARVHPTTGMLPH